MNPGAQQCQTQAYVSKYLPVDDDDITTRNTLANINATRCEKENKDNIFAYTDFSANNTSIMDLIKANSTLQSVPQASTRAKEHGKNTGKSSIWKLND